MRASFRLPGVLLFVALTAATRVDAQQPSRYSVSGDSVAIYNLVGDMRVEGGTGTAVTVEVTRVGPDASQLRIETGPIRGRETLRVIYPDDDIISPGHGGWWNTELRVRDDGTFNDGGRGFGRVGRQVRIRSRGNGVEAAADLRIMVPRGQKIAVYLGVGRAMLSNVDGRIRVDVSAADVTADHTKGQLTIDTGSGEVQVTDAEGEINIDTGSGTVEATRVHGASLLIDTGSGEVKATDIDSDDLNIDTGSGSVEIRNARTRALKVDTGSGEVDVRLLAPCDDIDIDTGSGGVTLAMPEGLSVMVDIETGSGGIDLGFPVQVRKLESDHVQGQIGAGKGRLKIDTGSGGIRLIKI